MCGIGGIATTRNRQPICKDDIFAMEKELIHRGPDDGESWVASSGLVGMAHRRLSILDLSSAGHQPMHSRDQRFTVVFNGEIYNFASLRKELVAKGSVFRSDCDTEVILELYARDGAECVRSLKGMYAIAIWDRDKEQLFLARDPLGIKPLYVWRKDGKIAFASELRSLLAARLGSHKLDERAIAGFLLMGSVQEPSTMIQDIEMLPPGHSLIWCNGKSSISTQWEIQFPLLNTGTDRLCENTNVDYRGVLRDSLHDSIRRHFVSDVPVGIFLSGGIDSTAILALAVKLGFKDLKTFSISFDDKSISEGDLARRTADHFGTDHHEWKMKSADGQELFSSFIEAMDQPSNDGFNTYCVSKLAHDHGVKVVLSGLGGDELFGSYPSFRRIPTMISWHKRLGKMPFCRPAIASIMGQVWQTGPRSRIAHYLRSSGESRLAYCAMRGIFTYGEAMSIVSHLLGTQAKLIDWSDLIDTVPNWSMPDQISYLELTRYMRNQLLRDSDVMSMAWGLELRVPFVDHTLVESVTKIPNSIRLSAGKKLLVDAVEDVPEWIYRQPKRGFSFPFRQWLLENENWRNAFSETLARCPVKPNDWYKQWMLVVLEHSIGRYSSLGVDHKSGCDGLR